ncbi:MAG: hypothetical protein J6A05_03685 [Oscillospiraceae bacterium]|nr:hypothetical protein [Oscillospiraceae bacterium]
MDDSLRLSNVGAYSKYSNTYIDTTAGDSDESNSYMNFDSYLKLLVSQMQNQDFNDPMKDSEVLNQMAQYSMLEGIKNMTQQNNISYSTSLVGKVVTVSDGYDYYTGKVESVTVTNGEPKLMIDGKGYDCTTVSDIVSDDVYKDLYSMVGKDVKITLTGETGKVTDVIFLSGEGYVVLNGKEAVPQSTVEIVEAKAETGETTPAEENVTVVTDEVNADTTSGKAEENVMTISETAAAQRVAAQSVAQKSQSLIDGYMKELDSIDEANGVSKAAEVTETQEITDEYVLQTAELKVQDYAAGVYADNAVLTGTLTNVDNTYSSGRVTSVTADLNPETAERTASGKLKGVTTAPGISEPDCVPHRISVEDYPEEAALADELGTRMYDIRYIHNTAITSRIKTDEIIGYTQSGKAITEIGYSGVGQLGEVITFADGTQRVEILLKSGKSTWMTTSGNLTLDEICTREFAPGKLTGKLTPFESAIRHYSHPTENFDKTALRQFNNYLEAQGITVVNPV